MTPGFKRERILDIKNWQFLFSVKTEKNAQLYIKERMETNEPWIAVRNFLNIFGISLANAYSNSTYCIFYFTISKSRDADLAIWMRSFRHLPLIILPQE